MSILRISEVPEYGMGGMGAAERGVLGCVQGGGSLEGGVHMRWRHAYCDVMAHMQGFDITLEPQAATS